MFILYQSLLSFQRSSLLPPKDYSSNMCYIEREKGGPGRVDAKMILPLHQIAKITLSSKIIINLWLHGYQYSLGPDNVGTQTQSTYL